MKKSIIFVIFGLFLFGCPVNQEATPPRPTPVVTDTDLCSAAETNLKAKQCIPANEPYTKKGKSFTQFCKDKQEQGIFLNPKCLSQITKCDQIDVCTSSK